MKKLCLLPLAMLVLACGCRTAGPAAPGGPCCRNLPACPCPPTATCPDAAGALPNGRESALAAMDFRQVVRDAKDKVFPAVVYIKCIRQSHESGKKVSEEVAGSGVIVSADGLVVSNWHVVDKAIEVRCLLLDGRAMPAAVVGTDKDTDLSLLQLKLPAGAAPLPHASFGPADSLKEGDFVMAMGAPWGLNRSVSIGIVSCNGRYLPEHSEYSLWLQTDATICPGNSGGPLVNTAGRVVGINTLAGGDLGFSIPSETVQRVIAQIREHGKVNWSWTGLQLQPLHDFNRNIYFDAGEGVIVSGTDPESPARRAGLEPKDRIVKLNGSPLTARTEEHLPAIRRRLGQLPMDKAVALEVVREGRARTVELTPRRKGRVEGEEFDCPRWDMTVKTVNQFDNPDLYYYRTRGVFVYGVKYPGNASNAGVNANEILLKIDGREVLTLADVEAAHKAALDNMKARPRVVLTLLQNGLMRQVVLDFARDYEKE